MGLSMSWHFTTVVRYEVINTFSISREIPESACTSLLIFVFGGFIRYATEIELPANLKEREGPATLVLSSSVNFYISTTT